MSHCTSVIPDAEDIRTSMHGPTAGQERIRVIRIGRAGDDVTLHVSDRATLDALVAALDTIRADMLKEPTP